MSDITYFKGLWLQSRVRGGVLGFVWKALEPLAWFLPAFEIPFIVLWFGILPATWRATRYILGMGEVSRWWFITSFNLPTIGLGSWEPWNWIAVLALLFLGMYLSWKRFRQNRFRATAKAVWWWCFINVLALLYALW